MEDNLLRLHKFLISIGDRLSNEDRVMLTFLLVNDVPRRVLDEIAHNNRAPLNDIWHALIERGKITPDNVDYLINCFRNIRRLDLVRKVEQYSAALQAENPNKNPQNASELFIQHNP